MTTAVERLFGDMHLAAASLTVGAPITYRLFVSSKLNPATGIKVDVFHDVSIRDAVNTMVDASEILTGSPLQIGDERWEFPSTWLADELRHATAKALTTSDRIVSGTASVRVIAWNDTGAVTKVTVRK
jgi:hypothetical protein